LGGDRGVKGVIAKLTKLIIVFSLVFSVAYSYALGFFLIPLIAGMEITVLMASMAVDGLWVSDLNGTVPASSSSSPPLSVTINGTESGSSVAYELPVKPADSITLSEAKKPAISAMGTF
jgi:hypothetical protein